jgi:hypothetical protein
LPEEQKNRIPEYENSGRRRRRRRLEDENH